jgi:predicted dehydrogenase
MSLRIALVGCGKIADGHVEEIQKLGKERASVVAACDRETLMAEQLSVRYGIPAYYGDFAQMLETEKPDVVHITTPPQSHLMLAKMAMDAGCHVYVEKPLTLNAADSRTLIEHAERTGRKLTIGYSYLFDPPALEMRELIQKGVLGEIVHIDSFFGYNLSGPFGAAILADGSHWVHHLPGKLFHNNIDHLLYKAVEFLDDERPCVRAFGNVYREKRFGDARDSMLDELRVMIQGSRVTMTGTFSSHIRPAGHFARIYGTKNTAHVDYVARTVTLDAAPRLPSAIGRLLPAFDQARQYGRAGMKNVRRFLKFDFHYFSGLHRLIAMFYDSIEQGTEPPIPYSDILRISRMMDEIFRQVDQEAPVS